MAPVDIQDFSGAAVKVCADVEQHNHQVYTLIGNELIDGQRIASAASRILGTTVEFRSVSHDQAFQTFASKTGLDSSEAEYLLEFFDLVRDGKQEMTSDDVKRLLQQTPTDVEGFLSKHLIDITTPMRAQLKAQGA
jgi:uncharacterized protein YbjT (DUF2867 family)